MLEESALDYEYQLVDLMQGGARTLEYLAINPGGKVPALFVDGAALTESLAIVNYLGALKPDLGLVPDASPFRRALYDQWTAFAITELEQPLWTISKHKFALPKDKRCADVLSTAVWEFEMALEILSQGLGEKSYILGDEFSAADIMVGHSLFWGMAYKQPLVHANLEAYVGRLGVRSALATARAKELAAQKN